MLRVSAVALDSLDIFARRLCLRSRLCPLAGGRRHYVSQSTTTQNTTSTEISFRKQFKEQQKRKRLEGSAPRPPDGTLEAKLAEWELTVGLEIHAQLNTEHKLFSNAATAQTDNANAHTALFDLALPGSQPIFQRAVLLPALRAALALNCQISPESKFDRKHYFYQDQPAGYQITQYYEAFARGGHLTLGAADDITMEAGEEVQIGIKQIQLEQDTAKTIQQPPDEMLLDFNRVGHPLIEIITLPQIHDPQTAAACARKIQSILQAVNAVTTGMELGGLRADVNVSVRRKSSLGGAHSYHGVAGLGQRTEIKNLSSFKAVEESIIAERNRQIQVLENGGQIEGETRGWSIGNTETKKLRGKEGEVDYRYMPDPDIPPLRIHPGLVAHIQSSLPMLPDQQIQFLTDKYGIKLKDAKTLVLLDDGQRLDYLEAVLNIMPPHLKKDLSVGLTVSNWILHELGGLLSFAELPFSATPVGPNFLASLLEQLAENKITTKSAKAILVKTFEGDPRTVQEIINEEDLTLRDIDSETLSHVARELVNEHSDMAQKVRSGQKGKFQWFVGQLIRRFEGKINAQKAAAALKPLLDP